MEYQLNCPECQKLHQVATSQAGQSLECSCGATVPIPTLRGLKSLPTVDDYAPSSIEVKDSEQSVWKGWRGPAIAFAATGLVIAGGYTAWFLLQLSSLDVSHTAEMEIQASDEMFDTYSPEELSIVWASYEEIGVREQFVPDFELVRRYALARKYLALISGSIASVFAIAAISVWISAALEKRRLKTAGASG